MNIFNLSGAQREKIEESKKVELPTTKKVTREDILAAIAAFPEDPAVFADHIATTLCIYKRPKDGGTKLTGNDRPSQSDIAHWVLENPQHFEALKFISLVVRFDLVTNETNQNYKYTLNLHNTGTIDLEITRIDSGVEVKKLTAYYETYKEFFPDLKVKIKYRGQTIRFE